MKVFVAGGTGAIGRRLVPQLTAAGHDVVATTRSRTAAQGLRNLGAEPEVVDGLDADGMIAAIERAAPEVVIHEMTALKGSMNPRRFDRMFATTNELRTRGTDALVRGALSAGARRMIVQSYAGWPYAREGSAVKDESDPLDPAPPKGMTKTLDAIRYLERIVPAAQGLEGVVLRYGGFYGPSGSMEIIVELVKKGRMPLVGDGAGVWSFVHLDDAASATVAALDRGAPGIYNVVDDDPAPVSEWLPYLAKLAGAKPPRRIPAWLGRIAAGDAMLSMMTRTRGASNAKAKRELGWQLRYPSWREGFAAELGVAAAAEGARPATATTR